MGIEYLLQENGFRITLEDGSGFLLLETSSDGPSGGRSQQKGVSIFSQDRSLGDRPKIKTVTKSESKLVIRLSNKSKSKILIPLKFTSESLMLQVRKGVSISKLAIIERIRSESAILVKSKSESIASFEIYNMVGKQIMNLEEKIIKQFEEKTSKFEKLKKIIKLTTLLQMTESLEKEEATNPYEFSFSETCHDEQLRAFTHSSSFIGNVQYNPDEQSMKIIINGKTYSFCNVPERVYDAFEGAGSKGAFFAREIKGLFNC